ncbi:GAP1-N1 domain-containing protein [Sphingomonas sp. Mn802worker]|uniref:GAP1-N1 domain-containing protein n=1 Tax=Sphingomonas sp. Mn802worker TaxID=629773 RepID=UPI0003A85390|nr:hypothetical protein [Sphingomonas sp. Mn802worker]
MGFFVHQTLHGYNDGHRLIAGSLKLENVDSRTMLVMSDLSGSGVRPGPSGYLTGYRLDDAGKYVLARTWAAPEMSRPGCVWTHSLLIDNADLAALTSTAGLLDAFQRPTDTFARSAYGVDIEIAQRLAVETPTTSQRALEVVNAIYGAPDRPILVEAEDGDEDETLVVAIWMQQWPRLRRAFGFCTLSGMDRSAKGVPLDLQMAKISDRHVRSRFPSSVLPSEVFYQEALEPLVKDLFRNDATNIREFLRRVGGDVDGGRRAMAPLCRLHTALFAASAPKLTEAVQALGELGGLGERSARNIRTLVARRAIEQIGIVDDLVFEFVIKSSDEVLPTDDRRLGRSLARELWLRVPNRFLDYLTANGPMGLACREALGSMTPVEIVSALNSYPSIAASIVAFRPDVLEVADFWRIAGIGDELANSVHEGSATQVALALATAGRTGPATLLANLADPADLVAGLEVADAATGVLSQWLKTLAWQPNKLASALASGKIAKLSTVHLLARMSEPDVVPNDYGEDPWALALSRAGGSLLEPDHDFLAAFMVSRALGGRSRSKAFLFRFGYGRLYRAFQQSRLPWEIERLVTRRLDWGSWFEWDNCSRLRETTVRMFVDGHLDPDTFGRLTDDGALANSLIEEAARSSRGRRYLREVRQSIRHSEDKGLRARGEYISKKVK